MRVFRTNLMLNFKFVRKVEVVYYGVVGCVLLHISRIHHSAAAHAIAQQVFYIVDVAEILGPIAHAGLYLIGIDAMWRFYNQIYLVAGFVAVEIEIASVATVVRRFQHIVDHEVLK